MPHSPPHFGKSDKPCRYHCHYLLHCQERQRSYPFPPRKASCNIPLLPLTTKNRFAPANDCPNKFLPDGIGSSDGSTHGLFVSDLDSTTRESPNCNLCQYANSLQKGFFPFYLRENPMRLSCFEAIVTNLSKQPLVGSANLLYVHAQSGHVLE